MRRQVEATGKRRKIYLKKHKQIAENNLFTHQDEEFQKFAMRGILLLGFSYLHLLDDR